MISFFSLMNDVEIESGRLAELQDAPTKIKLQFLAIIEEVALYAEQFEVDRPYSGYLFQWHFYFVYQSAKQLKLFG